MRHGKKELSQVRHVEAGPRTSRSRELGDALRGIRSIKDVKEPCAAGNEDAFRRGVVEDVVRVARAVDRGKLLSAFRIEDEQLCRLAAPDEETMSRFVE